MSGMEVKGLKQALANLNAIGSDAVRTDIGRKALRDGLLVINRAVKGATYTTFNRVTGFTRAGFGVRVAIKPKGTVLNSVIVQYPQSIAGTSAGQKLVRQHYTPKAKGRKQSTFNVAFWWRFLEFGTKGRRTARTPKSARTGRMARGKGSKASQRALARYTAAKGQGDIAARPWVGPAFQRTRDDATDEFSKVFKALLEAYGTNLSK